jgi:membrane dipeptidase
MTRSARILVLLICVVSSLEAEQATIHGTVRVRKTGGALAGVSIRLLSASGTLLDTTRTDVSGHWSITVPLTGVESPNTALPSEFHLGQNYPNPFNPSTHIPFTIRRGGAVRLAVFNLLGQLLERRELTLPAGSYDIEWRSSGSAGVFFYALEFEGRREVRKMVQLDGGGHGGFSGISPRSPFAGATPAAALALDSVRVAASSLIYEPDTVTVPLLDGTQADQDLDTIHDRAFVMDLHNDVVEQIVASGYTYQIGIRNATHHTDIPRLRDGGVDAQVLSIWVTTASANYYSNSIRYLDTLKAQIQRNSGSIAIATRADSIESLNRQGKIAGVVVCEGGECIESSLSKLRDLYNRGMRIMTITWNSRTGVPWARAHDSPDSATVGLNGIGVSVIQLMDSLGIVIDVSHVGPKTVNDILATSVNPIIGSHSCARALRNHTRNLSDAQIRAIALKGGVIGVNFYPNFVGIDPVTIDSVIRHIDYIRNLVGIDYVALGSDFDGIGSTPTGLYDVSTFPALTTALLNKGYTREEVRKLLGENFLRVFRAVCH